MSLVFLNLNAQDKPNVLFILADNFGFHDLSITGSEIYQTPNIDKIAEEESFLRMVILTIRVVYLQGMLL